MLSHPSRSTTAFEIWRNFITSTFFISVLYLPSQFSAHHLLLPTVCRGFSSIWYPVPIFLLTFPHCHTPDSSSLSLHKLGDPMPPSSFLTSPLKFNTLFLNSTLFSLFYYFSPLHRSININLKRNLCLFTSEDAFFRNLPHYLGL